MKHFKSTLALFSLAILLGCTANNAISSPNTTSSSQTSASKVPASSSVDGNKVYFTGQTAIDIGKMISFLGSPYNSIFILEEFGDKEFAASGVSGDNNHVDFYYDGQKIIEKMNNNICFASDVNNDGYREIITLLDRDILIVYDAFNNREMFHKSLHYDELSSFYNPRILYSYQFWIYNEKLLLWIYDGSASQEVYDYAYLVFNSETNSLEVEPQNMFDLESMNFVSLYNGENMMNPDANGVYTIQKGVRYTINILFNRKENADPNKIIETFSTSKNYLSQGGIYAKLSEYFLSPSMESFVKNSKGNGFDKFEIKFKLDAGTEYSHEGELTIYYVGFSCSIKYKLAN